MLPNRFPVFIEVMATLLEVSLHAYNNDDNLEAKGLWAGGKAAPTVL